MNPSARRRRPPAACRESDRARRPVAAPRRRLATAIHPGAQSPQAVASEKILVPVLAKTGRVTSGARLIEHAGALVARQAKSDQAHEVIRGGGGTRRRWD